MDSEIPFKQKKEAGNNEFFNKASKKIIHQHHKYEICKNIHNNLEGIR